MNRLIVIPLSLMFIIAGISLWYDPSTNLDYAYADTSIGKIDLGDSGGESQISFDKSVNDYTTISGLEGVLILLIVAIGASTVLGIRILGSGVSELTQKLIMYSVAYLGIWGILSVIVYKQIFSIPIIGSFIWILLTAAYMIGFVQEVGGAAQSD